MLDHFIAKNATAHNVNSYYTLGISYCTFCVGKHTILGPALRNSSGRSYSKDYYIDISINMSRL